MRDEILKELDKEIKKIKRILLKKFSIDRSWLLEFTRQYTDLYDKQKEVSFEKEVKAFVSELIEDKLFEYYEFK